MKTKFVRFIFLAGLLAFIILFAGCQPISENADGGTGGGSNGDFTPPFYDGGETGDGGMPDITIEICEIHSYGYSVYKNEEFHEAFCGVCNYNYAQVRHHEAPLCEHCGFEGSDVDPLAGRAKTVPESGKKLGYLIVASDIFFNSVSLEKFIDFKTQQGFEVSVEYVNSFAVENSAQKAKEVRNTIKTKYKEKISYILLVGDSVNVPAFVGTQYYTGIAVYAGRGDGVPNNYYVTDYFYGDFDGEYTEDTNTSSGYRFTGNYVPDAYVGRFSARNEEQLKPQVEKTIRMSNLSPDEAKVLKNHVLTQDVRGATLYADGVDSVKNYFSNITHYSGTARSSIITDINKGIGTLTYYGHAAATYWEGNGFHAASVNDLTNTVYPVVFSMSCYAGTFDVKNYNNFSDDTPCLGEAFLRSEHGAVAFIGANKESYTPYVNWMMGGKDNNYGLLKSLFPYQYEIGNDQISRSIGEANYISCISFRENSFRKKESLEQQMLFGDPSYMPYHTEPKKASLPTADDIKAEAGNNSYRFTTAPNAIVAVTKKDAGTRSVVSVAVADANGDVTVNIPSDAATVSYTLNSSAPQYIDGFVEF